MLLRLLLLRVTRRCLLLLRLTLKTGRSVVDWQSPGAAYPAVVCDKPVAECMS